MLDTKRWYHSNTMLECWAQNDASRMLALFEYYLDYFECCIQYVGTIWKLCWVMLDVEKLYAKHLNIQADLNLNVGSTLNIVILIVSIKSASCLSIPRFVRTKMLAVGNAMIQWEENT